MALLKGKYVIVGVGGGISAYRSLEFIRMLKKRGADVRVIPTDNALEFIGKISFESLSGQACLTKPLSVVDGQICHIEEAYKASAIVVAPATCDLIAKMAHGFADNLISQTLLSFRGPVLVAPAMESNMWEHEATMKNVARLVQFGYHVVGPEKGDLASGRSGVGRMSEPATILEHLEWSMAQKDFQGKKVLVTAGPTVEDIDPVRFLTNRSSGKMGLALAKAFAQRGANVHLVHGPVAAQISQTPNLMAHPTRSARDMYDKVLELVGGCDIATMCAAVADFTPQAVASEKIKKSDADLTLKLQRTTDILAAVGTLLKRPFLVGFAAETQNIEQEALRKLESKNCDAICANWVSDPLGVFEGDTNQVTYYGRSRKKVEIPRAAKEEVAHQILNEILESLHQF